MENKIIKKAYIRDFETALQDEEKSFNTIKKYVRDIKRFADFTGEREVDKLIIIEYKHILESTYALTSVNSMIAALNKFFEFLGWPDLHIKQIRIQKDAYCSVDCELTKQEYFKLIYTAEKNNNKRLSLIIQTICGTGIRISELEYITVEAVKKGEAIVFCKSKMRKVFIVPELCKKLLDYADANFINSGSIFITKSGKVVDRSNVWREMKRLCNQANISKNKVFPHNLRHLFARTFYGIDKDIAKLSDVLGHSNINTTRQYIITTGEEHRKILQNMNLIM